MDKIVIRVAGYEWALRSALDGLDDNQVMEAYEKAFPGSTFTDEGFPTFERGVMDAHFEDMPILSITDIARLANVSDRYVRQEVTDGRLIVTGEGKNRRATWRVYQEWMANPLRGSRRKAEIDEDDVVHCPYCYSVQHKPLGDNPRTTKRFQCDWCGTKFEI